MFGIDDSSACTLIGTNINASKILVNISKIFSINYELEIFFTIILWISNQLL